MGLGGSLNQAAATAPHGIVAAVDNGTSGPGISWFLAAIVLSTIIVVGVVVFIVERNHRNTESGN